MAEVKWMDYSGAPPILIPGSLLHHWNGFFLPTEVDEEDECVCGDLELPDGRCFDIQDEFDFQNPKTDYDRICAHDGSSYLYPLGAGHALVVSTYSDGTVGWWRDQNILLSVSRHLPDPVSLGHLPWKDEICWRIPDKRLYLLNSCLHGEQARKPADDVEVIDLEPGEYSITQADAEGKYCVFMHRFRRIGPL